MLTIRQYRGPPIAPAPLEPVVRVTFQGYSLHNFRAAMLYPRPLDISIARIQQRVADYYRLPLRELLSDRRAREVARPRQVAMYLCKTHTPRSLTEIARKFSRDHTTVIHAVRQIERLRIDNEQVAADVSNLRRALGVQ
jgi:chromosomal replication initiator protein